VLETPIQIVQVRFSFEPLMVVNLHIAAEFSPSNIQRSLHYAASAYGALEVTCKPGSIWSQFLCPISQGCSGLSNLSKMDLHISDLGKVKHGSVKIPLPGKAIHTGTIYFFKNVAKLEQLLSTNGHIQRELKRLSGVTPMLQYNVESDLLDHDMYTLSNLGSNREWLDSVPAPELIHIAYMAAARLKSFRLPPRLYPVADGGIDLLYEEDGIFATISPVGDLLDVAIRPERPTSVTNIKTTHTRLSGTSEEKVTQITEIFMQLLGLDE